jgi:hypothetical protein
LEQATTTLFFPSTWNDTFSISFGQELPGKINSSLGLVDASTVWVVKGDFYITQPIGVCQRHARFFGAASVKDILL